MTDNGIIKALECCSSREVECRRCPCADTNGSCYDNSAMLKGALDLINRQKAEIEKLNVELVGMRGACESYKIHYDNAQAEIERLKDKIFVLENDLEKAENLSDALGNDVDIKLNHIYDLEEKLKKAKSEAVKEFAERLKENYNVIFGRKAVSIAEIDNLVKEMTEEKERDA